MNGDIHQLPEAKLKAHFSSMAKWVIKYLNKKKSFDIPMDEGVEIAVEDALKRLPKFDPAKGKGFSYFLTCMEGNLMSIYYKKTPWNALKERYLKWRGNDLPDL